MAESRLRLSASQICIEADGPPQGTPRAGRNSGEKRHPAHREAAEKLLPGAEGRAGKHRVDEVSPLPGEDRD